MHERLPFDLERRRVGWWIVGVALFGTLSFFLYSFVGTFVLGLFVYYGARPIYVRLERRLSDGLAATFTLLCLVIPVLALLGYTGYVAFQEFSAVAGPSAVDAVVQRLPGNSQSLATALQQPMQFVGQLGQIPQLQNGVDTAIKTLGAVGTGLLHLTLALTFAFFLFRDGDRLEQWFRAEVGGEHTPAYAYLTAVDRDLETVYFGNVLTVLLVTVVSVVVYNGLAYVSPESLSVPFPTLLAVLTGLATFIPLVVGKVVYVPVAAWLGIQSVQSDASGVLWFPVVFAVVAFVVLDFLPQAVLRPIISGQTLHRGLILFAYVLGTALFGWYGLFLGPLAAVLVVQFANVVFGNLIRGESLNPQASGATTLGSEPKTETGADD
ncbi:Predicted PurR-regulated permease PerM [Halogranum amylolyticum]|uniref:Predicted PurR-regulated permease PerM n=1 Tax=Halogranum amylolyticum TaxID=660520 RepID=A0A1H8W0V7_9EURY|nr:AI-2E family transporter [Halogranum amylolyticum]SEP20798.1 Predicted PurR-regulated permease PerM [Halogranum amylolyticum]